MSIHEIRVPFSRSPSSVRLAAATADDGTDATGIDTSAAGMQILQQLCDGLHTAIVDLQTQQRQSLGELQQVAVELAVAAASWLTMTAIDRDQFNLHQLIAAAIDHLGGNSPVTVRLNPLDHELFLKLQQTDEAGLLLPEDVEVVSDAGLARGSCTAESDRISLVTDMETRLASVRQTWLENLDDAQTERRAAGRNGWQPGRVPDRRETA